MNAVRILFAAAVGLAVGGLYASVLDRVGFDGHGWLLLLLPAGAGVGALLATGRAPRVALALAVLVGIMPAVDGWVTARAAGRAIELQREAEAAVRQQVPGIDGAIRAGTPANACNQLVVQTEQGGHYVWYWYDGNTGKVSSRLTEERLLTLLTPYVPGASKVTLAPLQKVPDRVDFGYWIMKLNERGVAGLTEGCHFRLSWVTLYPANDRTPISSYPKLSLGE